MKGSFILGHKMYIMMRNMFVLFAILLCRRKKLKQFFKKIILFELVEAKE